MGQECSVAWRRPRERQVPGSQMGQAGTEVKWEETDKQQTRSSQPSICSTSRHHQHPVGGGKAGRVAWTRGKGTVGLLQLTAAWLEPGVDSPSERWSNPCGLGQGGAPDQLPQAWSLVEDPSPRLGHLKSKWPALSDPKAEIPGLSGDSDE